MSQKASHPLTRFEDCPMSNMIARRQSEECGCTEEEMVMRNVHVIIHMEPNGDGEAFLDAGDWVDEWHFESCADIDDLRQRTWDRISAMPWSD